MISLRGFPGMHITLDIFCITVEVCILDVDCPRKCFATRNSKHLLLHLRED